MKTKTLRAKLSGRKLLPISTALALSLAQSSSADSYIWDGVSPGVFSDAVWYDSTTEMDPSGPPGPGDNADTGSATLTVEGGSVMQLSGEGSTLNISGTFSANLVTGNEIIGSGQLSATTIDADLDINGTSASATTFNSSDTTVDAGGSLNVSGTLSDHAYLESSGTGSAITAQGGLSDVGLVISSGAQVTGSSLNNLLGSSCTISGSGSLVSVTGAFNLAEGATFDINSGASVQVGGKMSLDGGTNVVNGGGLWTDSQTTVQVNGALTVGNTKGRFSLSLENGAQLTTTGAFVGGSPAVGGDVTLDGTNTLWNVQTAGISVGQQGSGNLTIQNGAEILLGGSTVFAVGFESGSSGTLVVNGPGSTVDASGAPVDIGREAGSQGTAQVQNQAVMVVGGDLDVGDSGLGSLELSSGARVAAAGPTLGIGNMPGGNGTLDLTANSALNVQGYMTIGNSGTGFMGISGASTMTTSGTTIGNASGSKGTVNLVNTNSSWLETNTLVVGSAKGSSGNLNISQASLQDSGNAYIGDSGSGNVLVYGGGSAYFGRGLNQQFGIGNSSGGVGALTVADPGSIFSVSSLFFIGNAGSGSMVVSNGANSLVNILGIAGAPGSSGTLTVTGTGSSFLCGNNLFVGGAPVNQPAGTGNLFVEDGATLRAGPLFYISPSGVVTLDSAGQIAVGTGAFGPPGTLQVTAGGKLFGKGKVQGQVIVAAGGSFVPGGSPGIFTIDGSFEEQAGGETDIYIGGADAGTGFSQINVTGAATISGTLNVILAPGFTPPAGQTFKIFNAASVSGTFSQVSGAAITYGADGVTLSSVSGAAASPRLAIQSEGQNTVITWPEVLQAYSLQSTSSLTANSWVAVTNSAENTYVVPAGSPTAFYRLVQGN